MCWTPPRCGARLDALGFVPDAVVNCVAFNDVDGAEDRPEQAFALNAEFPGRLAHWTKEKGVPLVHYSTNYVFDGARGEYRESDPPAPLSAYGRSKWRGEQMVAENGGQWYVVRTAVIFGPKGKSDLSKKSFVDIMVDLAAKRDTVEAVADEVNSVTYAVDLAASTRGLLEAAPPAGIYHVTNRGGASWYDFAREIYRDHREKHDGAAGAVDPLSPQGEAPGAGGPAEYQVATAAHMAGGAGRLPQPEIAELSKPPKPWFTAEKPGANSGLPRRTGAPCGAMRA